jgi:HlyD family secretion protein
MSHKKRWWVIGGMVVLMSVIVIVASTREKGTAVQISKVDRETIQAKVSANGKIQAVKKVDISANTFGQVTRLAVKEGDAVKAGQFLLEIDPSRSQANAEGLSASKEASAKDWESAKARLNQAKSDFARAQANREAGIISLAEFEQAKTALSTAESASIGAQRRVDQAYATLRDARIALSKATLLSPMDGVVTAKRIEVGETAVVGVQNQPGSVLLTISDMSKVEAEMEVDEASIPSVKVGQEAQVKIDAFPNQSFIGQVTEVGGSPILKASTNEAIKFKVKVWIKNPPFSIKPGLSAQADISTGVRPNALAIPIQSLVTREIKRKEGEAPKPGVPKEEEGVYLMKDAKAQFQAIKTGLMGELKVEITEGLQEGEQVITGPFRALRDFKGGEKVRVDKKPKREGAKSADASIQDVD